MTTHTLAAIRLDWIARDYSLHVAFAMAYDTTAAWRVVWSHGEDLGIC